MPIEPTEPATTNGTDRRTFLTRSAAGGALVATVASAGIGALTSGAASAQEAVADPTVTQEYAARVVPLEMAASVAYQAALSDGTLSEERSTDLRQFQSNHQGAAELLSEYLHPEADAPLPDPAVAAQYSPAPGSDEAAILPLLASLEEALAATHLSSIASFDDSSFAKIIAQVLAVEEQQAVALGRAGGTPIEELTPATAPTDGALEPGQPVPTAEVAEGDESDAETEGEGEGETDAEGEGEGEETTETETSDDDAGSDADSTETETGDDADVDAN